MTLLKMIESLKNKLHVDFYVLKVISVEGNSISVLHAHGLPGEGEVTLLSFGLKNLLKKEFIVHCKEAELNQALEAIELLIYDVITNDRQLNFGSTIGGDDEIPSIPNMTAFYFLEPLYLDDPDIENDALWAMPIYPEELNTILKNGQSTFNELIDKDETADLVSIKRLSLC